MSGFARVTGRLGKPYGPRKHSLWDTRPRKGRPRYRRCQEARNDHWHDKRRSLGHGKHVASPMISTTAILEMACDGCCLAVLMGNLLDTAQSGGASSFLSAGDAVSISASFLLASVYARAFSIVWRRICAPGNAQLSQRPLGGPPGKRRLPPGSSVASRRTTKSTYCDGLWPTRTSTGCQAPLHLSLVHPPCL